MKNLNYIPFTRNRYFQGKLLTSDDFDQEQQYVNDKRRLINRYMLGAGIAAGLEVIQVDDYSISLEAGLALDYTGREIVVDTPVIHRLSALDGYGEATQNEGMESLYLYIEYGEMPSEPVHNITRRAVHTVEEEEYNKVKESYHLYVADEEPVELGEMDGCGDEARYISSRPEKIQRGTYQAGICLAAVTLVKAGDFYMIDQISLAPFHQYAYCQPLTTAWIRQLQQEIGAQGELISAMGRERQQAEAPRAGETDWQFAQGTAIVHMPGGGKEGRRYFSEETPHGLGLGNVQILLQVVQADYCYSGAEDIFQDQEKKVEAAVRLNRGSGTFVIGVRSLETTTDREVRVNWTAIRRRSSNEFIQGEERIFIKPSLVNIKVRQEIRLEAVCVNMAEKSLIWSVRDQDGGTVDENGLYHAPNRAGVYEVVCSSRKSAARASVFVIVRE